ncbi:DUF445 domain-containing protein [Galactobacter valiniphilus]|uniref:DUF445 domain-containing protein n=1 Tax=Galactobacter valiniphilus TaxID=2676122 RepID=UPI0037350CA6
MSTLPALGGGSAADQERRAALRRMKAIATGLLIVLAIVFVIAFALQERYPWLAYVRAAAEGGMVGALADWFAVTALFRRPLGLPIPHTALIPRKKDQIGESLGDFVEQNFLSDEVLSSKLASLQVAAKAGAWLSVPANASFAAGEGAVLLRGVLDVVSDEDVQRVAEQLVRKHMLEPEWSGTLGLLLQRLVEDGHHRGAVDVLADRALAWANEHPERITEIVSDRSPSWLPSAVQRLIGERLHRELTGFLGAVRADPQHAARRSLDEWLAGLAQDMQSKPETIEAVERVKRSFIEDPRLRQVALDSWDRLKDSLSEAAEDPSSELRVAFESGLRDLGTRLASGDPLADKVDGWLRDAAGYVVKNYRHRATELITDTVASWDGQEASERIELMVGRDLQFIRLNGTVVGSLAGLAIFAIAHAVLGG